MNPSEIEDRLGSMLHEATLDYMCRSHDDQGDNKIFCIEFLSKTLKKLNEYYHTNECTKLNDNSLTERCICK